MKILKRKKSQITENSMQYIDRVPFTIIMIFSIVFITITFIIIDVDTAEAQSEVYSQVFLLSKYGISYYDEEIDRVYPTIVEITNLNKTQQKINENIIFGKENKKMGARITYYLEEKQFNNSKIYYNKQFFDFLEPLDKLKGPGGSQINVKEFDITMLYNYEKYPGKIKIEVAVPNE